MLIHEQKAKKKKKVNWHIATVNALKIDLRDYRNILEYETEHSLGKGSYRIDLIVVRKKSPEPINKTIASHFRDSNIFEIKGLKSSATIQSYYRLIGYAGIYINENWKNNQLTSKNVTLNIISSSKPRNLFKHLGKKYLANPCPGIYDYSDGTFPLRIIVTSKLPPEDYLYLRSLTDVFHDEELAGRLINDFRLRKDDPLYADYIAQLARAGKQKGEKYMVQLSEGLLDIIDTCTEVIREDEKRKVESKVKSTIQELRSSNQKLLSSNQNLQFRIAALEQRLAQYES